LYTLEIVAGDSPSERAMLVSVGGVAPGVFVIPSA
jgi:hypothetical protein